MRLIVRSWTLGLGATGSLLITAIPLLGMDFKHSRDQLDQLLKKPALSATDASNAENFIGILEKQNKNTLVRFYRQTLASKPRVGDNDKALPSTPKPHVPATNVPALRSNDDKLQQLKADNEHLRQENIRLRQTIEQYTATHDSDTKTINQIQTNMHNLQDQLTSTENAKNMAEHGQSTMQSQLLASQRELSTLQQKLSAVSEQAQGTVQDQGEIVTLKEQLNEAHQTIGAIQKQSEMYINDRQHAREEITHLQEQVKSFQEEHDNLRCNFIDAQMQLGEKNAELQRKMSEVHYLIEIINGNEQTRQALVVLQQDFDPEILK
jgi:DNA repair exonuclease SbcCD ATPase subunit